MGFIGFRGLGFCLEFRDSVRRVRDFGFRTLGFDAFKISGVRFAAGLDNGMFVCPGLVCLGKTMLRLLFLALMLGLMVVDSLW